MKNRKFRGRRIVGLVAVLGFVAGVWSCFACKTELNETPTPVHTTATATVTTNVSTTTEVITTTLTTTTTINVVEILPDSSYTKAEVITDSVIVRDSKQNQYDWLKKGQILYLSGAKYAGMMEVYYTKDGGDTLLHGWVPENKSWVAIY